MSRRRRRRTGRRRRRRRALGALQRADVQRLRAAPPQGVRWQVSRTRLSPGGRANRTASIPMRFNARRGEAKTPRAGAREGLLRASRRGACGARRAAPRIPAGGSQVWTEHFIAFFTTATGTPQVIYVRAGRATSSNAPSHRFSLSRERPATSVSFRDQALWGRPPQGD